MSNPIQPTNPTALPAITPALVPGPRGGMLRQGNPGNRGGLGRMPSEIRGEMRESFYRLLPRLVRIASGKAVEETTVARPGKDGKTEFVKVKVPASIRDQLQAKKLLAEYGFGPPANIADVQFRLRQQIEALRKALPPEQAERAIQVLEPIWR